MKTEDKQLLLADLCGRLPYEVKVQYNNEIYNIDYISALYEEVKLDIPDNYTIGISEIKPYLHPMSSMTEEEKKEYKHLVAFSGSPDGAANFIDWLNKKMFDYRGLILKGLSIPITKKNNPYKALKI